MADQARTIRLPAHIAEAISKLARGQRQMLQDLGREPTPDESAAELDMTAEKVIEVQKYGREPISLHTPLGEDGDSKFGDLIKDSEAIQPGEALSFTLLQEQLHWVLGTPSEREAGVVSMRFGLTDGQPKTLDEIGKVYGVTRERIRQIESNTTPRLRHPSPVQARGGKSEVSQPDPRNRQTSPEAESGNDQLNLGTAPNTAPDNTPVGHRADRADRAARHGRDTAAPQPGRQPDPGPGAPGAARASQGRWLRGCGRRA
jgi:hypothetical protein